MRATQIFPTEYDLTDMQHPRQLDAEILERLTELTDEVEIACVVVRVTDKFQPSLRVLEKLVLISGPVTARDYTFLPPSCKASVLATVRHFHPKITEMKEVHLDFSNPHK